MTAEERQACVAALEAADKAAATLRAVLGANPPSGGMVLLSVAAQAWRCPKDTALKRARRGGGRKIDGRWYVPASAIPERS